MSSPLNPHRVILEPEPTRVPSDTNGYSHLVKLANIPSQEPIADDNLNQGEADGGLLHPPRTPPPPTPPSSPDHFTHHPSDPTVSVTITPPTPDKIGKDDSEDEDEYDEIPTPPKMSSTSINRNPFSDELMSGAPLSRTERELLVERYISFVPALRLRIPSPPFLYADHMLPGSPLIVGNRTASPMSDGNESTASLIEEIGNSPSSAHSSDDSSASLAEEDKDLHSPPLDQHAFPPTTTTPPVPTPLHPEHENDGHTGIWIADRTDVQFELRDLQREVEQLRLERSEIEAQVEGLIANLQALHVHSDDLVRTINPNQVSRALVDLCGIFCKRGPQGVPFLNNVDSLARAVGSPNLVLAGNHNRTLLEMMSRTCHILFAEFDRSLNTQPGTLCTRIHSSGNRLRDHLPPDVLWLFVNTADELLLLPLRDVLETMLSTCITKDKNRYNCRSIPIRLLLGEIDDEIFEDRRKDLMRYRWWAMQQRLKFERNNEILPNSIEDDTGRSNGSGDESEGRKLLEDMNDLRRASWQDLQRCLPKTAEEAGWDEAY